MGIRILKGGMMTTVQDLGRYGYQSQGFSVAGVMDVRSFKIANLLLDNPENEAVLEITLIGPTLEFTSATIIAITGGDFQPTINGEPAPMYTALYMNKGDVLKFGSTESRTALLKRSKRQRLCRMRICLSRRCRTAIKRLLASAE